MRRLLGLTCSYLFLLSLMVFPARGQQGASQQVLASHKIAGSAAFDIGINFRATSGYVTDGADETYCLAEAYPTTRGGVTFGWTSGSPDSRDRDSGTDRRLAGMNFISAAQASFRVDLPAAGVYVIRLALGESSNDQHAACIILDNTTTLVTISDVAVLGSHFVDATAVDRTEAAWPGSNAATSNQTFATTTLILKIGVVAGADNYVIAHLQVHRIS